jgi:hypothetical protein
MSEAEAKQLAHVFMELGCIKTPHPQHRTWGRAAAVVSMVAITLCLFSCVIAVAPKNKNVSKERRVVQQ